VVVHDCNPRTQKAEAEWRVRSQPALHNKTQSQKKKKMKVWKKIANFEVTYLLNHIGFGL
jgi:hypothetical protein